MKSIPLLFAAIAVAGLPAISSSQTTYTLEDMSVGSPYDGLSLNAINNAGHMTGYGVIGSTGEIHAFIFANGIFQDLGLLGYQASDGIAINNSDQLAADGIGPGSTALSYSTGHAHRLGSVDGGYSSALSINSLGDIVGSAKNGDGVTVGFSWIGGVFTDLSPQGIYRAACINDSRQIVGSSGYYWVYGGYGHSSSHGCLYSGGAFTDLGSLTGDPRTNTEANGINATGQIVGYSTAADGSLHAVLYSSGTLQDLGTLDGANASAIAINSGGTIIGYLTNPYGANLGAFVYSGGAMHNLGDLITVGGDGWSALVVTGLNDNGWIVGNGTVGGATHAFVLKPTGTAGAGTPVAALRSGIQGTFPNPFRSSANVTFSISQRGAAGAVRLGVYDAAGRQVAALVEGRLSPGTHTVAWDGRTSGGEELKNGIYFARLATADGVAGRKLVLLR